MTGEKKAIKSISSTVKKFEEPLKLTKQQKRDLKRNSLAAAPTNNRPASNPVPGTSGEIVKLTKQQKRDAKRNSQAHQAQQPVTHDIFPRASVSSNSSETAGGADKQSVYKRKSVYPPLYLTNNLTNRHEVPHDRFVNASDECYESVMEAGYQGFVHAPTNTFSNSFHTRFQRAFIGLERDNKYQYDVTQPAGLGTKLAMTYVTRCVVGDPGTTYKYLGLRMFSIPWTRDCQGASEDAVEIGRLNQLMIKRTQELLSGRSRSEEEGRGSCAYNLTLINRCFPEKLSSLELKDEPTFKRDKCTVSWHADSTLEHFSTIGVYHATCRVSDDVPCFATTKKAYWSNDDSAPHEADLADADDSWRIAMRVHLDAEGPNVGKVTSRASEMKTLDPHQVPVPPVVFALPNKSAYFLLEDFNHHHQHSVMVGDTHRFASTHRVCRTDGHTFQSIKALCVSILQQRVVYTEKYLRALLNTANIVEFEWIRQYYVQGTRHRETHSWWEGPVQELVGFWNEMRTKTVLALEVLRDAAGGACFQFDVVTPSASGDEEASANRLKKQRTKQLARMQTVEPGSFAVAKELLEERVQKRKDWHTRQIDPIFHKLAPEDRPLDPPLPPYLPEAEEMLLVPCGAGGGGVVMAIGEDVAMTPMHLSRLIDEDLLGKWERMLLMGA